MADPTPAPSVTFTVSMDAQGKISIAGPPDLGQCFLLVAAAQELLIRQFIPPSQQQSGRIVIPQMVFPDGQRKQ